MAYQTTSAAVIEETLIEYAESPCAFVYIIVTYFAGVEISTNLIGYVFRFELLSSKRAQLLTLISSTFAKKCKKY